jgi:hypothetical protein
MCALVSKARNLVVVITLKSNGRVFAAKIIDFDEHFIEVVVRVNDKGELSQSKDAFNNGGHAKQDRILVSLDDISTIA